MGASQFDPVSVVEAAYHLDADTEQWLEGITRHASRFFPDRARMLALIVGSGPQLGLHAAYSEGPPEDVPAVERVLGSLAELPSAMRELYRHGSTELASLSSLLGAAPRNDGGFERLAPDDVGDYVGILVRDPAGVGIQIGAIMPEATRVDPAAIPLWNRIGAHVVTGYRLRQRYRDLTVDSADAVIDPSGKLEHAASDHEKSRARRRALCEAAVSIERVRSELRGADPQRALALWQGLVRGEYSLLERFDTDGRRYYVARRNDPEVRGPSALTRRERQIAAFAGLGHDNQRIAYQMGLAVSTVATHLSHAIVKLGVGSRVELVQLARDLLADEGVEDGQSRAIAPGRDAGG